MWGHRKWKAPVVIGTRSLIILEVLPFCTVWVECFQKISDCKVWIEFGGATKLLRKGSFYLLGRIERTHPKCDRLVNKYGAHSHRNRKGPRSPAGATVPIWNIQIYFSRYIFNCFTERYCLRGFVDEQPHYTRPHGRTVLERNAEKIKYFDAVPCPLSIIIFGGLELLWYRIVCRM